MSEKCPNCGKEFAVLWPSQWAYVNGKGYFCSWKCLRAYERKEEDEMSKQRNDQLAIARELAEVLERGEDPDEFLASKGYTNTKKAYQNIKAMVYRKDPDLYERFPRKSGYKKVPRQVETPEGNAGPVIHEKPKKPELAYRVTAIKTEEFGEFYFDTKFNCIDWRTEGGDEMSMSPQGWKNLIEELPEILKALGVKL